MASLPSNEFLAGVIEGFYGPPWTHAERLELFGWMSAWGLNTYFYCPKDDLKQRALWREPYSPAESASIEELVRTCRQRRLHFIYALSPGLDLRYSLSSDLDRLRHRFQQMLDLGCPHFALLFDDIPDRLDPADLAQWGSLASAHSHVANTIFAWIRERRPEARFLFCPTPYCGRMMAARLGGEDYLPTLGRELAPGIDILWTGPDIVSRELSLTHVEDLRAILRRPPLIWDNLHANDYDGHRFYCGPYAGRPRELKSAVAGLLSNPNCEFPLNFVAIRTLAAFVHGDGPWDPREAYLSALREWLPHFDLHGASLPFEDLVILGDCYYLPYEPGPEAASLLDGLHNLLALHPSHWGPEGERIRLQIVRLRDLCARLAELRNRPLFYALGRRIWELREELDLLARYIAAKQADPTSACRSDFHLPEIFRGGTVARLQRFLSLQPDGEFVPSEPRPDRR